MMTLIPRAKQQTYASVTVALPNPLPVWCDGEVAERSLEVLQIFLDSSALTLLPVKTFEEAFLRLTVDESLGAIPEQYRLEIRDSGITLSFAEFAGGRNAAASLYQLICREGEIYVAEKCEILDYPDSRWRGVLLDTSWYFIPTDKIMDMLRQMALTKMNLLHFHLMDVRGYSLECEAYPELNDPARGFYTKEEMRQIIAFAARLGIDCMPEIEFVTHSEYLRKALPWLTCDVEHEETSRHALCIGKEETLYEFYRKVIAEVVEIFPFPILHIGGDEIEMYDIGYWPNWYDCPHCHALANRVGIRLSTYEEVEARRENETFMELGIDGVRPLFLHGIRKIYDIVNAAGKRMMMWNDNIDISKPTDLPRDILIHFWRISAPYRGPSEGCSMEKFLEAGFEVVNSTFEETYIEVSTYPKALPLNEWSPTVYPASDPKYHAHILGGEVCTWGGWHLPFTLPSYIGIYGDRFWNTTPTDTEDANFARALSRVLLGIDVAEGMDVFSSIGSCVIPCGRRAEPREGEYYPYGYPERVDQTPEELEKVCRYLSKLAEKDTMHGRMAKTYETCVRWVLTQKQNPAPSIEWKY